jgi:hypothetical protein
VHWCRWCFAGLHPTHGVRWGEIMIIVVLHPEHNVH